MLEITFTEKLHFFMAYKYANSNFGHIFYQKCYI